MRKVLVPGRPAFAWLVRLVENTGESHGPVPIQKADCVRRSFFHPVLLSFRTSVVAAVSFLIVHPRRTTFLPFKASLLLVVRSALT